MSDYVLRVSERQLRVMRRMAELYGRVAVGDFEAVADVMRCQSPADSLAARRKLDEAKQLLTGLPDRACHRADSHLVTEETRIALDIHDDLSRGLARGQWPATAVRAGDTSRRHCLAEPEITISTDRAFPAFEVIAA